MQLESGAGRGIYEGQLQPRIPSDVQQLARRRLRLLANMQGLDDLRAMPSLQLRLRARAPWSRCEGSWYSLALSRGWRLRFLWRRHAAVRVQLIEAGA
jgi:proteic killer suppression protein